VSGALKAAWALTAFVVVVGVVLWVVTGRAVFAVFIVLGLLTAVGAWLTGRAESTSKKEIP
jgi:dolichol kinase